MRVWEKARDQEARLRAEGRWDAYCAVLQADMAAGIPRQVSKQRLQYPFGAGSKREPIPTADYVAKHPEHVKVKKTQGCVGTPTETGGAITAAASATTVSDAPLVKRPMVVKAKMFKGKTCDERTAVQWVVENLMIVDVKPEQAPSATAWTMLMECRTDKDFRRAMLQSIWPKLLPSKSQLETTAKFEDTGAEALDLIRNLRAVSAGVEA